MIIKIGVNTPGLRHGMRQHSGRPTSRCGDSIGIELGEGGRVYEDVTCPPLDVDTLDSSRTASGSVRVDGR